MILTPQKRFFDCANNGVETRNAVESSEGKSVYLIDLAAAPACLHFGPLCGPPVETTKSANLKHNWYHSVFILDTKILNLV